MSPGPTARTRTVLPLPRQGGHDRPVGQVLVQRGLLAEDQLAWALDVQRRTRSRLGEVLVSSGLVSRMDLHRALARAWDLPFVDVPGTILDPDLVAGLDHAELSAQGWLPLHRGRDGRVLVAVTERPGPALRARIETHVGAEVDFAVTSSWDIAKGLTTLYRDAIVDEAAHGLWRRSPQQSALTVPSRRLRVLLAVLVAVLLAAALLVPSTTLVAGVLVLAASHTVGVASVAVVTLAGRRRTTTRLPDDALPVHTVLVPVPRGTGGTAAGSAALRRTLAGLEALDYPADKLEVLLLVEEGDRATRASVTEAGIPETVTFLAVPSGGPATRALACNVGLFFARGELLVVLDVGDVPAADQLRAAASALRPRPQDGAPLVAVQAPVDLRAPRPGPLTALAALERAHRSTATAGQARLGLPLPLGGPGSHVRTEVLRRLGGWDPWNDAEDADLGVRAHRAALRTDVLDATLTRSAAGGPAGGGWTATTARSLTGRAQATLVSLRGSEDGSVPLGRRLLPLVAATGGTTLLGPSTSAVLLAVLLAAAWPAGALPGPLLGLSASVLAGGAGATALLAALGAVRSGRPGLLALAPVLPLLGVLQAVAAGSALVRLLRGARRTSAPGAADGTSPSGAADGTSVGADARSTATGPGGRRAEPTSQDRGAQDRGSHDRGSPQPGGQDRRAGGDRRGRDRRGPG